MSSTDIREARRSAGVSQGELAKESGVNRQRLSYIECGYVTSTDDETRGIRNALRRIVERRMAAFRGVLQAV